MAGRSSRKGKSVKATVRELTGRIASEESGYLLAMSLLVMFVLTVVGVAVLVMGVSEATLSRRQFVMDQAYLIAEGGIDRALIACSQNENSLSTNVNPGVQWTTTEKFGGDDNQSYTAQVFRNDEYPTNGYHKRIVSTGNYNYAGGVVTRKIEAKVFVPVLGKDYDASFDYVIFNGNNSGSTRPWPQPEVGSVKYWMGQFLYDGSSPDPEGHVPKGAVYMNGNLNFPCALGGSLVFVGNVVATGDIRFSTNWAAQFGNRGIQVIGPSPAVQNGKVGGVIAGLGKPAYTGADNGAGNCRIEVTANLGFSSSLMIGASPGQSDFDGNPLPQNMSGITAAGDVTVEVTGNTNWGSPCVIGAQPAGGGIWSGGNVTIGDTANILAANMRIGHIWSVQRTKITSMWSSGMDIASIHSGVNPNNVSIDGVGYSGVGTGIDTNAGSVNVPGGIYSRGKVVIIEDLANVSVGAITAGNDLGIDVLTGGDGLYFEVDWAAGMTIGNVTSTGRARFTAKKASGMTIGTVAAGNNGGTGILFDGSTFCDIQTGALTAVGSVLANNSDGTRLRTGAIWSGGSVNLNGSANWVTDIGDNSIYVTGNGTYSVRAVGSITGRSADNLYFTNGDMIAMGSIDVRSIRPSFLSGDNRVRVAEGWTVNCGGNVTIRNDNSNLDCSGRVGNINAVGSIDVRNNDPINVGTFYAGNSSNPGSTINFFCDANTFSGDSYAGNFWSANTMTIEHDQFLSGDLYMGWLRSGTHIRFLDVRDEWPSNPDIHTGGKQAPSIDNPTGFWGDDLVSGGRNYSNPGYPPVTAPTVTAPGTPTKPPAPSFGVGNNVDTLGAAGLDAPIRLLEPSWSHFMEKAQADDAGLATPIHVLDSQGQSELHWSWTSADYSSNETVYLDDENCTLVIDGLSFPPGLDGYTATVVARGDVRIDAPNTNWFVNSNQTLNIIAGGDIRRTTAGFKLASQDNCTFHFYAGHDIELQEMDWKVVGVHTFFGSFTAGNRVYTGSTRTIMEWTKWKWSRWGLDPVGWVPPFKVSSWREI